MEYDYEYGEAEYKEAESVTESPHCNWGDNSTNRGKSKVEPLCSGPGVCHPVVPMSTLPQTYRRSFIHLIYDPITDFYLTVVAVLKEWCLVCLILPFIHALHFLFILFMFSIPSFTTFYRKKKFSFKMKMKTVATNSKKKSKKFTPLNLKNLHPRRRKLIKQQQWPSLVKVAKKKQSRSLLDKLKISDDESLSNSTR